MTTDREGCCADWPKPCSYHEGWADGRDALLADPEQVLAALGMEQVGYASRWGGREGWYIVPPHLESPADIPLFARVPVPEPSEGAK